MEEIFLRGSAHLAQTKYRELNRRVLINWHRTMYEMIFLKVQLNVLLFSFFLFFLSIFFRQVNARYILMFLPSFCLPSGVKCPQADKQRSTSWESSHELHATIRDFSKIVHKVFKPIHIVFCFCNMLVLANEPTCFF